jgi:hypothetical protein
MMLLINLCLAIIEWPSSLSQTSDVRVQHQSIQISFLIIMTIEGLTLLWFLFYISMKVVHSSILLLSLTAMIRIIH